MTGINHESAMRVSDADRNGTLRRLHNAVALGLIEDRRVRGTLGVGVNGGNGLDLDALLSSRRTW